MAEYIKFRLAAAKAGVTMAFFALLGGLIGTAEGQQGGPSAKPASFSWGANYLKLTGLDMATQKVFSKLEYKLNKLFLKIDHTLTHDFYGKHKIDTTFLKITTAQSTFETQQKADKRWLKITDANANFLKIGDANNEFLKIGGTAANSSLLGNLAPTDFLQGHGNVLTNELLTSSTQQQTLLSDGAVKILIALDQAGQPSVTLENDTSSLLNFTLLGNQSRPSTFTISGNGGQVSFTPGSQTDIQIFGSGGGGAGKVWTVSLSTLSGQGGETFVGQLLIGLL